MLRDIQNIVLDILENDKKARSNDKYLIAKVLERKGLPTDIRLIEDKVSFETITRARRLLQARNPELKASRTVQSLRDELEEEIKATVIDKGDC